MTVTIHLQGQDAINACEYADAQGLTVEDYLHMIVLRSLRGEPLVDQDVVEPLDQGEDE